MEYNELYMTQTVDEIIVLIQDYKKKKANGGFLTGTYNGFESLENLIDSVDDNFIKGVFSIPDVYPIEDIKRIQQIHSLGRTIYPVYINMSSTINKEPRDMIQNMKSALKWNCIWRNKPPSYEIPEDKNISFIPNQVKTSEVLNIYTEEPKYYIDDLKYVFALGQGEEEVFESCIKNLLFFKDVMQENYRKNEMTADLEEGFGKYISFIRVNLMDQIREIEIYADLTLMFIDQNKARSFGDVEGFDKVTKIICNKLKQVYIDCELRESAMGTASFEDISHLLHGFQKGVKNIAAAAGETAKKMKTMIDNPVWAVIDKAPIDTMISQVDDIIAIKENTFRKDPVQRFLELPDFLKAMESTLLGLRKGLEGMFNELQNVHEESQGLTIIADALQYHNETNEKNLRKLIRLAVDTRMIKTMFDTAGGFGQISLEDQIRSGTIVNPGILLMHYFVTDAGTNPGFKKASEIVPGGGNSYKMFRSKAREVAFSMEKEGYNFLNSNLPLNDVNQLINKLKEFEQQNPGPEKKAARDLYASGVEVGMDAVYKWRDYMTKLYQECTANYVKIGDVLLLVYKNLVRFYNMKMRSPSDFVRYKQSWKRDDYK